MVNVTEFPVLVLLKKSFNGGIVPVADTDVEHKALLVSFLFHFL